MPIAITLNNDMSMPMTLTTPLTADVNGADNNSNNGNSSGNNSGNTGFAPFQPRAHQPVTYTAGTFAQTKFGSTKLKSNAKKTNRMSPTEFSNYIKQRAMQKQATGGQPPVNMANGFSGGRGPIWSPNCVSNDNFDDNSTTLPLIRLCVFCSL